MYYHRCFLQSRYSVCLYLPLSSPLTFLITFIYSRRHNLFTIIQNKQMIHSYRMPTTKTKKYSIIDCRLFFRIKFLILSAHARLVQSAFRFSCSHEHRCRFPYWNVSLPHKSMLHAIYIYSTEWKMEEITWKISAIHYHVTSFITDTEHIKKKVVVKNPLINLSHSFIVKNLSCSFVYTGDDEIF